MWAINWSSLSFNLRLLSWLVLVASAMLITFSLMIHSARKWIRTHPTSRISKALSLDFFALDLVTRLNTVKWALGLVLMFNAGAVTGWYAKAAQDRNFERGPYKIHVIEKHDNRNVLAEKIDDSGKPLSEPFDFGTCADDPAAPSFDAGRCYVVKFRITADATGECNTFTGPDAMFKECR